jgi:hypothetical protein
MDYVVKMIGSWEIGGIPHDGTQINFTVMDS